MSKIEQRAIQAFEFEAASPSQREPATIVVEWSFDKFRARSLGEFGFYNYDVWIRPFGGTVAYYAFSDTAALPGYPASCIPQALAAHILSEPTKQTLTEKIADAEMRHLDLEDHEGRWSR